MKIISVRQASLADLEDIAALFNQYREFQGMGSDLHAAREFLRERFNHGESTIFLAFDEGCAVGFAQLYPIYSSVSLKRVFILNDLFVHESVRRRGAATKLLVAVESYAWCLGSCRVTLNVARENISGQVLYESEGWKQDDQFYMYHLFPHEKE